MIVNVEFLGNEPIENVITAVNFKIDKTIFFGYEETIKEQKECADKFLKKYCGVKYTEYISISHTDIDSIIKVIRSKTDSEIVQGNEVFFDITGGESIVLVAFGILVAEKNLPMHLYDIRKNKLTEYSGKISSRAQKNHVKIDLDKYIEMYGGVINRNLHKDIKDLSNKDFSEKVEKIWNITSKYRENWNLFSQVLKRYLKPDNELYTFADINEINSYLEANKTTENSVDIFKQILQELQKIDILQDVLCADGKYSFRYHDMNMKRCLWDSGSILELHTYRHFMQDADDCRVGVHIDWDGMINRIVGADVFNEIDVLVMNGNIPTFISCKGGNMATDKALHALYELETVATRFGKKYVRKILVITAPLSKTYQMRADEMGIETIVF